MNLFHKKNGDNKELATFGDEPFEDLWSRFFRLPASFQSRLPEVFQKRSFAAMNVSEDETSYQVILELPGLEEKDIDIRAMGRQLVISGERKWEEETEGKEYHQVESQFGSFQRSVTLPAAARVDPDDVQATYEKGMLTITVPKVEPTPTRKIEVKSV